MISPNVWITFLLLLVGLESSIWAEELVIRPKRDLDSAPFETTIAAANSGARIFYTTNGSMPATATRQFCEHPIPIHATTVLRAGGAKRILVCGHGGVG